MDTTRTIRCTYPFADMYMKDLRAIGYRWTEPRDVGCEAMPVSRVLRAIEMREIAASHV